jgi:hypothetical protein
MQLDATRPAQRAMPRKPLYLATRSPLRVSAQGESLLVRRPQAADQRFPVARIDRVVSNAHAEWTGEAIALCLARGVVVTWIDARGGALGHTLPRQASRATLAERIESFVESPDWAGRYANWLRAQRMRVLVRWASRRRHAGTPTTPAEWEDHKREFVYGGSAPAVFAGHVRAWLDAWVAAHLHRARLPARIWGWSGTPLELCDDLAGLLWAELNLDSGEIARAARGVREEMLLFEGWAHLHGGRIVAHLADLERFVARENESWQ